MYDKVWVHLFEGITLNDVKLSMPNLNHKLIQDQTFIETRDVRIKFNCIHQGMFRTTACRHVNEPVKLSAHFVYATF